ncbi:protein kinase domain-containing protein [Thiolapillus sp.]
MATDDSAPRIPGYRIVNLIGRGANATVYLALQESLNRHVALKILQKFDRPAQAVRFFNEGQIVASMNHPNIITIYDIGSVGSQQYIAMEYLDGGSLKDRIKEQPSPTDALDITQAIGSALDFVHQMGIVHRDIKPENILFHKRGIPKITDFGVAKALDRDMNLTMDGTALGSPYYLSPEQAEGKELDGRSDIYSLGVILFEMLAGHKPYLGESQIEVIFGHLNQPIPSLPKKYRHYQGLVEKMMAKNPQDRFSSAQEMLQHLNALRSLGNNGGREKIPSLDRRSPLRASGNGHSSFLRAHPWLSSLAAMFLIGAATAFLLPSEAPPRKTLDASLANEASVQSEAAIADAIATPAEKDSKPLTETDQPAPAETATTEAIAAVTDTTESQADVQELPEAIQQTLPETVEPALPVEPDSQESQITETAEQQDMPVTGEPSPHDTENTLPDENQAATDTAAQIAALLTQAREALKKYRLTSPRNSSAYHYYREILKLDPHNRKASRGIRNIARRYATLAQKALDKGDENKAQAFVKRGLRLNSRSKALLAMQQKLDDLEAARRAPPPPPKIIEPPPPPPKPEPVNSSLQLLESLE